MKRHGDITKWVTTRKRAWDEHRLICTRQGVTPLPWETFKRLVMRLDAFQEMVDCGVLNARRTEKSATIIPSCQTMLDSKHCLTYISNCQ